MGAVVIYATLLLNGMVNVIQYKADTFKTYEECISYLQKYNLHINKTLEEHIYKKEKVIRLAGGLHVQWQMLK